MKDSGKAIPAEKKQEEVIREHKTRNSEKYNIKKRNNQRE